MGSRSYHYGSVRHDYSSTSGLLANAIRTTSPPVKLRSKITLIINISILLVVVISIVILITKAFLNLDEINQNARAPKETK